jgi:hypothetical protein
MTTTGKLGESCNSCKKGQQRLLIPIPLHHQQQSSLSAQLDGGNRGNNAINISMLPTPTRVIVKTLLRTLFHILLKLWRWASSFIVLIFLAAWFYGGFLPYCLFIMGLLSKSFFIFKFQPNLSIIGGKSCQERRSKNLAKESFQNKIILSRIFLSRI